MPALIITSILQQRPASYFNKFDIEITNKENSGIIFLFAGWSESIVQLNTLNESLIDFSQITLYIFDIDHIEFWKFADRYNLHSDGWGETFWFKNGNIVCELKKYNRLEFRKLLANNHSIL